jgi:uncharacterized protein YcgL (UPF0745 family)
LRWSKLAQNRKNSRICTLISEFERVPKELANKLSAQYFLVYLNIKIRKKVVKMQCEFEKLVFIRVQKSSFCDK